MSNRDDFSRKTRNAVAARAGWHCSFEGCGRATIGPSDESPEKFTDIGKAAHIAGAAAGPGSRRYDPTMTAEQRKNIRNAIWLCGNHADLIDRDEVTYTVDALQRMKSTHEAAQAEAVRDGLNSDMGTGLLAIGPDIICAGDVESVSAESWTLRIRHFLIGDHRTLISFIDAFQQLPIRNRYLLSTYVGDGRLLSQAPTLMMDRNGQKLLCPVEPACARIDAQKLGSSFALDPETNDMYVDDESRSLARVSGVAALPQYVRSALSMQRGENVFAPKDGVRFFEYFEDYSGSPLLNQFITLDVIRQASIQVRDAGAGPRTPLQCVTRVRNFEFLSLTPENNRLPVRADFEVQGVGGWQHDFSIYMPTKDEMAARARLIAERPELGYPLDEGD
jgi:hypothetical protein